MMPIRGRTRAQERAQRIAGERRCNRNSRTTSPDHPTQNGPRHQMSLPRSELRGNHRKPR
ncbi:hypothetical protein I547_4099 [Mycobacterium kansasii 824]|nr:hypothetical protein I547_4099 [Mycobacterium kansasii 824]